MLLELCKVEENKERDYFSEFFPVKDSSQKMYVNNPVKSLAISGSLSVAMPRAKLQSDS